MKKLQKYFKEVCEEIKGITDTIGVDYSRKLLMMNNGCQLENFMGRMKQMNC